MTGALLLAALMAVETLPVPPPGGLPNGSPLRASIARAAASVTLAEPPAPAPPAAAHGTQRCSKKAGAIAGAIIGGIALGFVAHQAYEPNFVLTQGQQTWLGAAFGTGVGVWLGYEACGG